MWYLTPTKGFFRYNRLPFGIASRPRTFQHLMEGLLQDIPKVIVYLDGILITGSTRREHLQILDKVRCRLEEAGLRLFHNHQSLTLDMR